MSIRLPPTGSGKVALLLFAPQNLRLPEVRAGLQRWAGHDRG